MISKLSRLLNKNFWTNLIVLVSTSVMVMIVFCVELMGYFQGEESVKTVVMFLGIFLAVVIVSFIGMSPLVKDRKLVKVQMFCEITGKVIKYRRVLHGGDPDTTSFYPTIQDVKKDWVEVELKAEGTQIGHIYHCLYLPNTKLAVCEEAEPSEELGEKTGPR